MANVGDKVSVHYTGTLDNGEVFDSSVGRDPLSFQVGNGDVIAGFDDAVKDMAVGDKKKIHIAPERAYGKHDEELMLQIPTADAPKGLAAGDRVQLGDGSQATVVSVAGDTVTVDANHPLAGKALNFEIELVSLDRATRKSRSARAPRPRTT